MSFATRNSLTAVLCAVLFSGTGWAASLGFTIEPGTMMFGLMAVAVVFVARRVKKSL